MKLEISFFHLLVQVELSFESEMTRQDEVERKEKQTLMKKLFFLIHVDRVETQLEIKLEAFFLLENQSESTNVSFSQSLSFQPLCNNNFSSKSSSLS